MNYICPLCGAYDSRWCRFRISVATGTVVPSQQDKARAVGCRVMYYTDQRIKKEEA